MFLNQILRGLALMKDAGIIHCDLKPENILLCTRSVNNLPTWQSANYVLDLFLENYSLAAWFNSVKPAEIKIIDFGSACMEDRTVYSYIQVTYLLFLKICVLALLLIRSQSKYFTFLCRVGTIDHLKFFLDISILACEICCFVLYPFYFLRWLQICGMT